MATMKAGFISQGADGIVKARAVEDQLMRDTWDMEGYDLLPKLPSLTIPTLWATPTSSLARSPPTSRRPFPTLAWSR
jgi:hypothetical protein